MFLSKEDQESSDKYRRDGYLVGVVDDRVALDWIRGQIVAFTEEIVGRVSGGSPETWLDDILDYVGPEDINAFRLKILDKISAESDFRRRYFCLAKSYLEALVGNELAMQMRINLSIQLPMDESSLLPVHTDTWAGNSPFEVVVWVPLTDCYGTKSMYILPPIANQRLNENFSEKAGGDSEALFQSIASDVHWCEVSYGQVMVFDQTLAHGNRVNMENAARWSLNCRFKGVFTPYGDKGLGEYFEPITLRVVSSNGAAYRDPIL